MGCIPETPYGCAPVMKVVSRFSDHLTSRNLNWLFQTGICRSLIILVRPNAWVQPVILIRPNCFWRALINSRLNLSQAVSVLTVKSAKPYYCSRVLGVDIRASRSDPILSSVMIHQRVRWSCQREITSAASSVFYWKAITTKKCSLDCDVITYSSMMACLFHKGKLRYECLK